MALNKYATIRYRVIDRCLRSRSHPFPSKELLRQACEDELYGTSSGEHISISTIEKDLWALKNESSLGYAPIVYNKAENGYLYSNSEFSLDLPLTKEDIELIRLATTTLVQFKDSQVFSDLETAIEKIQGRLNVYQHMGKKDSGKIIRFESAPAFSGSEHLACLLDNIRNNHEIKLKYVPFADEIQREYTVQPYLLQEHKNRWYLICYEVGSDKFRTLGLDRIQGIENLGKEFSPKEEFNPEVYYRYSFGIGIYSGKPESIKLWVETIQAKYLKAQPIHETQQIVQEEE
ncbi:MAG: WYL domain-containing protein, partial [Bacteroidetes bacterium]|nr:WYL domain-containing protein [Bacteroidota bacterium]